MTGPYAIHKNDKAVQAALKLARGPYQRDIITGHEAMSGATLTGKAAEYGGKYKESRDNLIARLRAGGVPVAETRGAHNKRILVIG